MACTNVENLDITHKYIVAGPISIDQIEKNLYLGSLSAAMDINTLTKYAISHILTIDTCPLPRHILEMKDITTKFIQLCDFPKEDILSHLDDAYDFIQSAITEKRGRVLVHCYFGISRSASIVIAYVMKKYHLSYIEAFKKVKWKRSMISPNQGFVSQLNLYHEMSCTIDKSNKKYKMFRLSIAAAKVKKATILPNDYFDLIKPDPSIIQIQPEPNVYRCKKCRRVLASESNVITHKDKSSDGKLCTNIYFLEPIAWMDNITQSTQGKLYCPKCRNKIGSFSWVMGCSCPCGCLVTPAFYLTPCKVDRTNVVKNVEVTI